METRERVLQLLQSGRTAAEISRELGISKPAVSKHVAKLVEAGLWKKAGKEEAKSASLSALPPKKTKSKVGPKPPPGPNKGSFRPGDSRAGAPPGNKNAVTTGEHETIWDDVLDEDERHLFRTMDTGKLAQIEHEIKLITIRERRMLQRIEKLRQLADADGMTTVEITEEEGEKPTGPVDAVTRKRSGVLGQIQDIEDALTRVQEKKTRLLELKHKIEKDGKPEGAGRSKLEELLAQMEAAARASLQP